MSDNEKITVLVANHNYSKYIEKAINSAIGQTRKPDIICVVDDGSSDDSWSIISSFTEQNQKEETTIPSSDGDVLIKVGNIDGVDIIGAKLPIARGPSNARNVGILLTKDHTTIYSILDADDAFLPTKLEVCIQAFTTPNIGLVYANYYNINSETGVRLLEVKEPYDIFRLNQECIVHSGFLIRASILEKIKDEFGYYDNTMRTCEDWDLELRAARHCNFYHIPEALTNVLVHSQNSTNSVNKSVWEQNWRRIQEKHHG